MTENKYQLGEYYMGDCPNPGDFEKVIKNTEACIKMQEKYYKWREKQPIENNLWSKY